MLANRIGNRALSILCDRVGVAFDVGHDPHKIFKREGESLNRAYAARMRQIAAQVEAGGTLAEALRRQGNYFPRDFVQMIDVGERTGRLEIVLSRLGSYYKELSELRTEFINSIIWPVIQVAIAIVVVGAMIYVPSIVAPQVDPKSLDLLGIGLVGAKGLRVYLTFVFLCLVGLFALYWLGRNGFLGFVTNALVHIPFFRKWVLVFPEARFVQTLALALESGLDTWNSVGMAFNSAGSPAFTVKSDAAKTAIRQGRELHQVLSETGLLSRETIEAIQLGEESGRLAETLDKQFQFLRVQVKSTLATLTYVASSVIWAAIAGLLILIIFRVFSNYISNIDAAGEAIINRTAPVQDP